MICDMKDKWQYSCCFVGCCFWDLFKTAHSIIAEFSWNFLYQRFVKATTELYWHGHSLKELTFYFIREIGFLYIWLIVYRNLCLSNVYVDIAFSRWYIATEICEMVFWFQRPAIYNGHVTIVFKTHGFSFIDILVDNASCSQIHIMQQSRK